MLRADSTAPYDRRLDLAGHVRGCGSWKRLTRWCLQTARALLSIRWAAKGASCACSGALATRLAPYLLTVLCPLLPPRQLSLSESSSEEKLCAASVRPLLRLLILRQLRPHLSVSQLLTPCPQRRAFTVPQSPLLMWL